MAERLQKLISAAGIASRRAAEALIAAGRVTVNGETASLGASADRERDTVCVDGVPLRFAAARTYIMLHKPRGYVTTLSDERGRPTVAELVRDAGARLYPVGRLDMDSEGLLLLTDDGAFANALTHPSHEIDKVYRVTVSGDAAAALPRLRAMREIDGEPIRAPRAELSPDGTLTDERGQTYRYLYWEGTDNVQYDFSEGFCVPGSETAAFLEDALVQLGLTRAEANEFIIYWLPQMEQNAYNLISFQSDAYTDAAKLTITPQPDTLLRVFMAWKPLTSAVEIAPQTLTAPERTGFTAVEWGGAECK